MPPESPAAGPAPSPAFETPGRPKPLMSTGLDVERLVEEYSTMTDAQLATAESELDLRKTAVVLARLEREKTLARRFMAFDDDSAGGEEDVDIAFTQDILRSSPGPY